ncbi:MAG: stalk domain-containing protein [Capsulimonadales bacterium]|nr:stalk domain-containing protein [Capsulimonadales bacterium]
MNIKNLPLFVAFALWAGPTGAQEAIVQTNSGETVTTVTQSGKKTTVVSNAPATGARQTTRVTTRTRSTQPATVTTESGGQRITVTVNRDPVTFAETSQPVMMSGRVMIPLRGVTERLGGNVLYDPESKVITGAHPGTGNQFRLRVGSGEALLNGQEMALDAAPQVLNGTTYVPLRFVSEALGAKVNWEAQQRTVLITVDGNQATVTTAP